MNHSRFDDAACVRLHIFVISDAIADALVKQFPNMISPRSSYSIIFSVINGRGRTCPPSSSSLQPAYVRPRPLSLESALDQNEGPPNPLWIIVIGMALFFAVPAFLMRVL